MTRALLIVLFVAAACSSQKSDTAPPTANPPSACAGQASELRSYLTRVLDPAQQVAAPWPTGDAEFDAELPKLRDTARELAKPADPSKPVAKLTEGVKPGRLEAELASCPAATAQLGKVSEASPDRRAATFVELADAIATCDCRPSIPRVKALVYLMQRGPD
ncbi:MAG: hypothetical protein H6Q90_1055 [Deltaproteobacteria bacterium]|nr:hypothetical protein [Deltaproteobacteria bacterium]